MLTITDRAIEGPHGPIPIRIYEPERGMTRSRSGLVWLHGGGWVWGGLDDAESDWTCRELAQRGITSISVDYQLSPSFDEQSRPIVLPTEGVRFPVAHDEARAAFRFGLEIASDLGVDPALLSLGGASAGANLAAGAALHLLDDGERMPASMLLLYPLVHGVVPPVPEDIQSHFAAASDVTREGEELLAAFVQNYIGPAGSIEDRYAFIGGQDLRGFPPTCIINSEIDQVRGSGELLAAELASASADVLVIMEKGTLHGQLSRTDDPAGMKSIQRMAAWLDHPALWQS